MSSFSSETDVRNCESIFSKILDNPVEYCNLTADQLLLLKPKIMKILKSYKPVKLEDYQYGLSRRKIANQHLIVFEFQERTKIREYALRRDANIWYCCECSVNSRKDGSSQTRLIDLDGIIFVSLNHRCQARDASKRKKKQKRTACKNKELAKKDTVARGEESSRLNISSSQSFLNDNSNSRTENVLRLSRKAKKAATFNISCFASFLTSGDSDLEEIETDNEENGNNEAEEPELSSSSDSDDALNLSNEHLTESETNQLNTYDENENTFATSGFVEKSPPKYQSPFVESEESVKGPHDSNSGFSQLSEKSPAKSQNLFFESEEVKKDLNKSNPDALQISENSSPKEETKLSDEPEDAEKLYEKIVNNFIEYSNESIQEDFKQIFLTFSKSHRPLKLSEWQYGLSYALRENRRIITFEFSNRSEVREYGKSGFTWYCRKRLSPGGDCSAPNLQFVNGILFVPLKHQCQAREFSLAMKIQELLRNRKPAEARRLSNNAARNYSDINTGDNSFLGSSNVNEQTIDDDSFANQSVVDDKSLDSYNSIISALQGVETAFSTNNNDSPSQAVDTGFQEARNTTMESVTDKNLKRKIEENNEDEIVVMDRKPEILKRLKVEVEKIKDKPVLMENGVNLVIINNEIENHRTVPNAVEEEDDDCCIIEDDQLNQNSATNLSRNQSINAEETDDCMIVDKKPQIEQMHGFDSTFSFDTPSSFNLRKICEKLEITYNHKACQKLWGKIEFQQVGKVSTNIKLDDFKTRNISECFCLLLTGTTEQSSHMQSKINQEFQNYLITSGKKSQREIDNLLMTSVISDEHLSFIGKFLPCRIVIFKETLLCRYGNWQTNEENPLTFVFGHFDGLYSIVLDS